MKTTAIIREQDTVDNACVHESSPLTTNPSFQIKKYLAYLGLVATTFFWAGNFLLSRMASYDFSPLALSFWRWLFAFLIICPFGYRHIVIEKENIIKQLNPLLVLSALGIAAYNTLVYIAAHSTTAINMTLFAAALPVTTILLAWLILSSKPSPLQIIGLTFSVVGFFTVMTKGSLSALLSIQFNAGDLLMILAILCWALYSVLFKKWGINLKSSALLTILFGLGTLMIFPFYLYSLWNEGGINLESHLVLAILYLAIFPSILAFLFWNQGLQILGPNVTAIFMYLVPIFTALLSIPVLGERLHNFHFIGGGAILLGVYFATIFNDQHKKHALNEQIERHVTNSIQYLKSPKTKVRAQRFFKSAHATVSRGLSVLKMLSFYSIKLLLTSIQALLKLLAQCLNSLDNNLKKSTNAKP